MRRWLLVGVGAFLPLAALAQTYHAVREGTLGCKDPAVAFILFTEHSAEQSDPATYKQVSEKGRCRPTTSHADWALEKSFGHTVLMRSNNADIGTTRLYSPLAAMVNIAGQSPPVGTTDDGPDLP